MPPLVSATIALPILPADRTDPVVAVNPDAGETVGWRELVEQVASVTDELPAADRPIILTSNYGEAGAIDRYRSELGLPPAYSGHNGYWEWGPPPESRGPVVLVGYRNPRVLAAFWDCQLAAKIENRAGVDNDENGAPIWACAGVREPWPWLWPRLRRLR